MPRSKEMGRRRDLPGDGAGAPRAPRGPPPATCAALFHLLRLPDLDRVERVGGEFWSIAEPIAELVTDCEKGRSLRAVLVGMLREAHGR
jgi:hypothetical protein